MKYIIFAGVLLGIHLLCPENALAWGPGVHVVTALSALSNISVLLPPIGKIITEYPLEYLYGSLSADFFIGKGRKKRKKSHPHNWEGGLGFLAEASCDQEAAYAFGFLSHLAADVVAHNIFVPQLMSEYSMNPAAGHLYVEMKADYMVGPVYVKIARDVLTGDHKQCDDLLRVITEKGGIGLKAKKRIYTQWVRFYDYFYTASDPFFHGGKEISKPFGEYLKSMVDLSDSLVKDFLTSPASARCLGHDPLGRKNLLMAKRKRLFYRVFSSRRPARSIPNRV